MKLVNIKFWCKDSGNMMSHAQGLTREQVFELKTLEEGDRLILWRNDRREKESDCNYALKVYKKSEVSKDNQ